MKIDFDSEKPVFMQIAEQIEDAIFLGAFAEETQIPSTNEISIKYKVNPATALKGVNVLQDKGIVYKRRGLGVFVSPGAVEKIRSKRQGEFFDRYILSIIEESRKLNISKRELINLIERGFDEYESN